MRFILALFLVSTLTGCGLIQAQKNEEARRARMEQEREAYEAFVAENARRRGNVKNLKAGLSREEVEAMIGPSGFNEMKSGKLTYQYLAGGFPMKLVFSKSERLVEWEQDQAAAEKLHREAMAYEEQEERARQAAADREQSRRNAVIQYMGTTKPRTCQQYMVGGVLQTQCH